MPQLVTPHLGRRFEARDDHVTERDRTKAASRQDDIGEATIADVEKATIPAARTSEREQAEYVPDRIGVVRDEGPADCQRADATTVSTAARTRSRVVTDESKWMVMSLSLRSTSTDATPSICRHPSMMCSAQL